MRASTPESAIDKRPRPSRLSTGGSIGLAITIVLVLATALAERIAPGDPFAVAGRSLQPPSWTHLLGTDNLGRDLFRGVIHGLKTSMHIVGGVVAISSVLGVLVGAVAGYRRGLVDDLLMRLTELFQAIPRFFLALMAIALIGPGTRNLILLLGLTSWTLLARVLRAGVLAFRERPYVEAARSFGASGPRLLLRHILPQLLPTAFVVISLTASRIVLIEAGLAYLGLGDQNRMSLGYLASNAQNFFRLSWWMVMFPGGAIALMVLGFSLLSDGLGDVAERRGAPTAE